MIERMPTNQVVTILKGAGPAEAARILLSIPVDRISLLLAEMEPSDVTGLLVAAGPDQKEDLLAALETDRVPSIIRYLSLRQLVDLAEALSPETAARCLETLPAPVAAGVIGELPGPIQERLLDLVNARLRDEVMLALYQRSAQESIVRIASTVSWLDQTSCDLLAVVLDGRFQIAVRYRYQSPFVDADVDGAVSGAAWQQIAGLVVLTNVVLAASARGRANDVRLSGRRVALLRWNDRRDDGELKRALARMTSG
jgi:hypothetical protein